MKSVGNPDYINKRCWLVNNSKTQVMKRCRYCQRRWRNCLTFQYLMALPALTILFVLIALILRIEWPEPLLAYLFIGFTLTAWIIIGYLFNRSVDDHVESSYRLSLTHQELAERTIEQAALYDIVRMVNSTLDMDKILDFASRGAATAVGAESAGITLMDGDTITDQATFGPVPTKAEDELRNLMHEVMNTVIATGHPVVLEDVKKDPRFSLITHSLGNLSSFICAPIQMQGANVGTLTVSNKEDGVFGKNDLRLVRSIADQIGVAILNSRLYAKAIDEKYRSDIVIESAGEGICVLDNDRRIVQVNRAWEKLTGWTAEEIIGKKCSDVQKARSLDDRDICYTACCFDNHGVNEKERLFREVMIMTKSGEQRRVFSNHAFTTLANGDRWFVIVLSENAPVDGSMADAAGSCIAS